MKELLKKLTEIEESSKGENCQQDTADIKRQCVRVLQMIGEKLLTEYYVQFGNLRIDPLRVEAYYFHKGTFEDCTTYGKNEQKEYNRLFLHGSDIGREGVDICIGSGEAAKDDGRYLSFLIKDAIVTDENGESVYCKQTALYYKLEKVKEIAKSQKTVLQTKPKVKAHVFNTVRNGLSEKPFGQELLGSLIPVKKEIKMAIVGEKENGEYPIVIKDTELNGIASYDYETGFGADQIIAQYLKNHPEENKKENWDNWWKGGIPSWAKETLIK